MQADLDPQGLLDLILTSLDEDKAEDVLPIALKGKSEIADHMVVASGRSSRQVAAMAEHLVDKIKATTGQSPRIEGKDTGDWVLLDAGDVIVHLFRPEVREFYQLEKMWANPASNPADL
nr:ribosome silencing factor [Pontivivens insulae]